LPENDESATNGEFPTNDYSRIVFDNGKPVDVLNLEDPAARNI
jgi:hypothetical protein